MSQNIVAALSAGKFKKLFVFVAAALMLSGCGQSSNENASKDAAVKNEAAPVAVQQTIRVGSSADYPPFEYIDEHNKIVGFEIDMIEAVGKKIGVKFDIQNMSFDGLIPALKTGKIDAALSGMSATEERRKSVDFTKPYYFSDNLFIRKKGTDVNATNMHLKKISAQIGTLQESAAKSICGDLVVPAETVAAAILSLKAGKIDVVLTDSPIGYEYLKQNSDLEEFLKLPDGTEGFAVAFDKGKHLELIGKIDAAIEELKKSGEFDKMMEKYSLK